LVDAVCPTMCVASTQKTLSSKKNLLTSCSIVQPVHDSVTRTMTDRPHPRSQSATYGHNTPVRFQSTIPYQPSSGARPGVGGSPLAHPDWLPPRLTYDGLGDRSGSPSRRPRQVCESGGTQAACPGRSEAAPGGRVGISRLEFNSLVNTDVQKHR
jgi:hypothetical protein